MDMTKYAGSESKYLKAGDLKGKEPVLEIESVREVEFDEEGVKKFKPAISFAGKEKAMVLNPTSVNELMRKFGSDSESWIGKRVRLGTRYYQQLDKEGLVVTGLVETEDFDDDIPF